MKKEVYRLIFISAFLTGCHYYNHDLSFKNNTPLTLSVSYTNDTTLKDANNVAYYISASAIIEPDSVRYIVKPGKKDAWLEYINESNQKKLFVYVWNVDTLRKYDTSYTMSDLKNAHKYIKWFFISKEQLMKSELRIKLD